MSSALNANLAQMNNSPSKSREEMPRDLVSLLGQPENAILGQLPSTTPADIQSEMDGSNLTLALRKAAARGDCNVARQLIKGGVNVNQANTEGETALQLAAENGEASMIRLLLSAGASGDAQNASGWTALHSAAYQGHHDAVDLLLEAGVDASMLCTDGLTARQRAGLQGHNHVLQAMDAFAARLKLKKTLARGR
jgi:ankyrin repeat protein